MSDQVNVRAIEALRELARGLRHFSGRAEEVLTAFERQVRRTLERLNERVAYWRAEVEKWEEQIDAARSRMAGPRGGGEGARGEAAEQLQAAEMRLQRAREGLGRAQRWRDRVEEEVDVYSRHAQRLLRLITDRAAQAVGFLDLRQAELEDYVQVTPPGPVRAGEPREALAGSPSSGGTVGDPRGDAAYHTAQDRRDACCVVTQGSIIKKLTGQSFSEKSLCDEAVRMNSFTPGKGTLWPRAADLLRAHGVMADHIEHAELADLERELRQGTSVIALVEAGELWQCVRARREGHAVWVTGLDADRVYLNDSGNPDIGAGGYVPLEVFMRAWAAFGQRMIVARSPSAESPH